MSAVLDSRPDSSTLDSPPLDAIVVNSYGNKRKDLVETTIATLRRTVDWDRARLIVVDTCGDDHKRAMLAPFVDVLECVDDPDFGEGAGWNLGVGRAIELGARHIAMVNDDICFHDFGWFEECVDKLERFDELAVMTPYGHAIDAELQHPVDHGDPVYGHHNIARLHDAVWIRNRVPFQVWVFERGLYERFGPFREVGHKEQLGWVSAVCPDSMVQDRIREAGLLFGATDRPAAEHTGYGPGVSYWQHKPSRFDESKPTRRFVSEHLALHGKLPACASDDDISAATRDGTGLRVFQIELTNRCPFTCIMCPRGEMTRELGDMDPGLFRRIVDQLGDNRGEMLYLHHFGESLVHPRFGELVRYASDRGLRTHVSCNPNVLTEAKCEDVLASGLSSVMFSIDGMSNEVFQGIRGQAAEIRGAVSNFERFLQRRESMGNPIEVAVQMIDMKANAHEQQLFEAFFRQYERHDVRVSVKAFDSFNEPKRAEMGRRLLLGRCTIPFDHMTVLWDGSVVPCCHDEDGAIVLGDASRQSLAEIWRGRAYRHFRAGFLSHPHCERCSWR